MVVSDPARAAFSSSYRTVERCVFQKLIFWLAESQCRHAEAVLYEMFDKRSLSSSETYFNPSRVDFPPPISLRISIKWVVLTVFNRTLLVQEEGGRKGKGDGMRRGEEYYGGIRSFPIVPTIPVELGIWNGGESVPLWGQPPPIGSSIHSRLQLYQRTAQRIIRPMNPKTSVLVGGGGGRKLRENVSIAMGKGKKRRK